MQKICLCASDSTLLETTYLECRCNWTVIVIRKSLMSRSSVLCNFPNPRAQAKNQHEKLVKCVLARLPIKSFYAGARLTLLKSNAKL